MSLSALLKKLDEKNKPVHPQKEGERADRLYFAWVHSSKKQQDFSRKDNTPLFFHLT